MKLYIAGPMTGHENYNFAAFERAEEFLLSQGHEVVSPRILSLELAAKTGRTLAEITPAEYMRTDLAALLTCEGIAMLDGWWYSWGATHEYIVAACVGLELFRVRIGDLVSTLDRETYVPPNVEAERLVRAKICEGLRKHGAESWKDEPPFNHLLKAARHCLTHELQRTGWSAKDGEIHAEMALARSAMAYWQCRHGKHEQAAACRCQPPADEDEIHPGCE